MGIGMFFVMSLSFVMHVSLILCCLGYMSLRLDTTSGMLSATGVSDDICAMALLNWSLSAVICAFSF